jgi:hypothetical protein
MVTDGLDLDLWDAFFGVLLTWLGENLWEIKAGSQEFKGK